MPILIEVEGNERIRQKMQEYLSGLALRRGVARAGAFVLENMRRYPPAPAGSRYRRTGTLGRRWNVRYSKAGLRATVGNNTPYAPYVQGHRQTHFHRDTGWVSARDFAEGNADQIQSLMTGEIDRIFGR